MNNNLKILYAKIDNFLYLKEVEVKPDSKLNMFIGKNSQGKTNIIEAIKFAFKGTTDEDIINVNADKARVFIDLGKYKIKRTLTKKSHTLVVENEEGDQKKRAQTFLDQLIGNSFALDPFAIFLLKDKELKKYLLDLFEVKLTPDMLKGKIDQDIIDILDFKEDGFTVLNNAANILYSKRKSVNQQANTKQTLMQEKMRLCHEKNFNINNYNPDASKEYEASLRKAENELSNALFLKSQADNAKDKINNIKEKISNIDEKIDTIDESEFEKIGLIHTQCEELREKIKALQDELRMKEEYLNSIIESKNKLTELKAKKSEYQNTLEMMPSYDNIPDIDNINNRINDIQIKIKGSKEKDKLYGQYIEAKNIEREYQSLVHESSQLTEKINFCREILPKQLVRESKIPIKGMSFDGDKIFIDGKPLRYMSTSDKIKVALDIVREINKNSIVKVLCVDRAESLDEETLKEFRRQIKDDEFQYIMTKVQHGNDIPDDAFIVENGKIKKKDNNESI